MLSLVSPKYEFSGGLCVRRSRDVLKKRPLMHPLIIEDVSPLKSFLYGYITPLSCSNILSKYGLGLLLYRYLIG
jgi:hypothetical protein